MRAACGCYFWDLPSDEKFIAHTRAMEEKKTKRTKNTETKAREKKTNQIQWNFREIPRK